MLPLEPGSVYRVSDTPLGKLTDRGEILNWRSGEKRRLAPKSHTEALDTREAVQWIVLAKRCVVWVRSDL